MDQTGKPRTRKPRPATRFLLAVILGVGTGVGTYRAINRVTRPAAVWVAEFDNKQANASWDTLNLSEKRYPSTVATHHERWFVIARAPLKERPTFRAIGINLKQPSEEDRDWYFIDPNSQMVVGPWQPKLQFETHGFHPDGLYIGIGKTDSEPPTWSLHTFAPKLQQSTSRVLAEHTEGSTHYALSSDCTTLAFAETAWKQPLRVRCFDVATDSVMFDRTFTDRSGHFRATDEHQAFEGGNLICVLSPTSKYFAIGDGAGDNPGITILDTKTGSTVRKIQTFPVETPTGTERLQISSRWGRHPIALHFDDTDNHLTFVIATGTGLRTKRHRATCSLATGELRPGQPKGHNFSSMRTPTAGRLVVGKPHSQGRELHTSSGPIVGQVRQSPAVAGTDLTVVSMTNEIPGREPSIPFARGPLDSLGLDQAGDARYVQSVLQFDQATKQSHLIRQLELPTSGKPTPVYVRSGHAGVVVQKEDRQVLEAWPLPQFTVPWVKPTSCLVGLATFGFVLLRKR